jgi:hypothetical protein
MFGVFDDDAAAAVGWKDFVGDEFAGAVTASRFPGTRFLETGLRATRFCRTRFGATHWFGLKTQKAQAWRLRLWFPSRIFSLYLYFINLDQVNRKFWRKYICFEGKEIRRTGCFEPLDKISGFRGFYARDDCQGRSLGSPG